MSKVLCCNERPMVCVKREGRWTSSVQTGRSRCADVYIWDLHVDCSYMLMCFQNFYIPERTESCQGLTCSHWLEVGAQLQNLQRQRSLHFKQQHTFRWHELQCYTMPGYFRCFTRGKVLFEILWPAPAAGLGRHLSALSWAFIQANKWTFKLKLTLGGNC